MGRRREEGGGNVQGRRSIIGSHKIDGERSKNGIGNREFKELICTTHGHELRVWGMLEGGYRGINWENCNSIINKIYFKKEKAKRPQIKSLHLSGKVI